ncbi:MAG: D-alanyl-D-alanine carboxypeptidase [Bacilli bacterium]|nr:D-alanyl-D-alanine carboxypeptidase [Bacilli bacterium]
MKKIFLILTTFFMLQTINALELNSKYVYVYNDTLDKVMYEMNANEEVKVASMTKIMTAIIVIEKNPNLEKVITIKDEDLRDMYEYTTTGFQVGHEVTIRELLYGILLRSGSDAVNAAVRVTTDTEDEFIDLMNQKVKELNLKNTYFSNAVGKDKDNYSSVHDIAKIMEYCLKNQIFKEIISTPMHYIDRLDIQINGPLYKKDINYNLDLSIIKGSKSGYTSLAKHSLVSYGEKDGITYIVVTDYADNYKELLTDNSKIYEYFFNNYGYKKFKTSFNIKIENSKQEKYTVHINTNLYLKNDYDESLINYKYKGKDKITYLNKKGSKLGSVSIYYDNELISNIDVKLLEDIEYETKAYTIPIVGVVIFILLLLFVIKKRLKKKKIKIKYNKVKIVKKKIKEEKIENVEKFIKEENSYQKKIEILKNTIDINLFFDILKSVSNVDKQILEKDLIDRCFQNINFENIEDLKDLYTRLKLYKNEMSKKTINYYNKLFKYCIENYIDKK